MLGGGEDHDWAAATSTNSTFPLSSMVQLRLPFSPLLDLGLGLDDIIRLDIALKKYIT